MLKRKILAKIWEKIDTPEVLLLNGARQVGKTSLLKMIKERLILEKNVLPEQIHEFDLEKIDDLSIWSNQNTVIAVLPKNNNQKHYIFIDEFQKSKNIGSILKVLHDHYPYLKIIITGSASWYLSLDESLAGRKIVFSIWPLSFEEFVDWKKNEQLTKFYELAKINPNNLTPEIIALINNSWLEFLTYGGYPAVVLADKKEDKINILSELLNSYLLRDIKIWNYAANSLQVKKILTLLASQISSLLDISTLSDNSGLGRTALINRLELLQNTFILQLIRPYFTNKTKELIKNPKIYLADTGLRNSLLQNFSTTPQTKDFGFVAENFIMTEIIKNSSILDQILFWRTKTGQEVDVVIKNENELTPIEIKAGDVSTIPSGLKYFINLYHPKTAYILNWSINQTLEYDGCKIYFRPLWLAGTSF